jgi:UDP:flavonoid glycosyltransferase YjiC (YdhE family)
LSRILIVWQLGANYGHLGWDLHIAEHLRHRGHEVSFAVRDLRLAAEQLDHPIALGPLLPTANWVVSYGGVATTAAALLAGVPLLIVPQVVEQPLLGLCVERIGAGVLVGFRAQCGQIGGRYQ